MKNFIILLIALSLSLVAKSEESSTQNKCYQSMPNFKNNRAYPQTVFWDEESFIAITSNTPVLLKSTDGLDWKYDIFNQNIFNYIHPISDIKALNFQNNTIITDFSNFLGGEKTYGWRQLFLQLTKQINWRTFTNLSVKNNRLYIYRYSRNKQLLFEVDKLVGSSLIGTVHRPKLIDHFDFKKTIHDNIIVFENALLIKDIGNQYRIWTTRHLNFDFGHKGESWEARNVIYFDGGRWPIGNQIAFNNEVLIVIDGDGKYAITKNGFDWQYFELIDSTLNDVRWTGKEFVVVGSCSVIMTSKDGMSWELKHKTNEKEILVGIGWNNHKYVAMGISINNQPDHEIITYTSDDLSTWTQQIIKMPELDVVNRKKYFDERSKRREFLFQ